MKTLFIIPARAGSKGVPGKNIKLLGGKPLISYSILLAKEIATSSDEICVSTDDLRVVKIALECGVITKFLRPANLSTDNSSSNDVYLHAIEFYESQGIVFDRIVVLQPTSPFRRSEDVKNAMDLYSDQIDMVVSVNITSSNPYYVLFEENNDGFLINSKAGKFVRRQDCPVVYELNGAVYVINIKSLRSNKINDFDKVIKYVMPEERSLDIDTYFDWVVAENLVSLM